MHRLKHIDSIRGLAALAVIYSHVLEYPVRRGLVTYGFEQHLFNFLVEYLVVGKVAVTVFFAVSGFVIPFSLFKFKSKPILLFAISRFFRLYPAYWVSIPFGLFFLFVLPGHAVSPQLVIMNMTMLQQFFGVQNIIELYWTLQIELIFYVICAMLFAMKRLDDVRIVTGAGLFFIACAVILGAFRFFLEKKYPVALPLSLSVMFWGLCIRFYAMDRELWRRPLIIITAALIVFIPIVSMLAYNKDMGFQETWYKYTATYYLAIALFYLLYRYIRITNPVFVYLGTISYSVYLFGYVVQEALLRVFGNDIFLLPVHVFMLVTSIATIAVASVVYRWVEAPAVALGRKIIKFHEAKEPAGVPVPEPGVT